MFKESPALGEQYQSVIEKEQVPGVSPAIQVGGESSDASSMRRSSAGLNSDERWLNFWGHPLDEKVYKNRGKEVKSSEPNLETANNSPEKEDDFPLVEFSTEDVLSQRQKENGARVNDLYGEFYMKSGELGAGEKRAEILKVFQNEESELKELGEENGEPNIQAFIATRNIELKKMEVELEILWIEKQMYDLHIPDGEYSKKKAALQEDCDKQKYEILPSVLEVGINALKAERDLLLQQKGTPLSPHDWIPRLSYVVGRLIGFEDSLRSINTEREARKNPVSPQ